jgi:hypothetical protein
MTTGHDVDLATLLEPVARRLWGAPNESMSSDKELRWGTRGSRTADLRKNVWFDHEAGEGGDTIDLITREKGHDGPACYHLVERRGLPAEIGRP